MAVRTVAKERRKIDVDISVADLQNVLKKFFVAAGSRDVNALFAKLHNDQPAGGSGRPDALADTMDFFIGLFEVCKNGKIPGSKLELAITNEHGDDPVHSTKHHISKVAARCVDAVIKAAKIYRGMKDDTKTLARFMGKVGHGSNTYKLLVFILIVLVRLLVI